jgi:hypothetical protein
MNLFDIIFQPYVIILFISIIITLIAYYIINEDNKNKDEDAQTNVSTSLLYTFLSSFIGIILLKTIISYLNKNNTFQKNIETIHDKLTIVADDVDYGILED